MRITLNTLKVAKLFLESTAKPLHGYDIAKRTQLGRAGLYSALDALEAFGWVTSKRELSSVAPPRRNYLLTEKGFEEARAALDSF